MLKNNSNLKVEIGSWDTLFKGEYFQGQGVIRDLFNLRNTCYLWGVLCKANRLPDNLWQRCQVHAKSETSVRLDKKKSSHLEGIIFAIQNAIFTASQLSLILCGLTSSLTSSLSVVALDTSLFLFNYPNILLS